MGLASGMLTMSAAELNRFDGTIIRGSPNSAGSLLGSAAMLRTVSKIKLMRADGCAHTRDRERSATSHGLPALLDALSPLSDRRLDRVLDVGCGFGGLTQIAGQQLGASELHGVDIDGSVIEEAASKGVAVKACDVERQPLPYEDACFDFVMSFGMIDYLRLSTGCWERSGAC